MKKIKTISKVLAVFLSILFIVEILPMQVIADAYNNYASGKDNVTESFDSKEYEVADILYEVTDKRDKYTKVFKRADGTYTAAISKTPVHFEENGEWKDIDNTLEQKGDVLTNKSNALNVEFPTKLSENKEIKLENDGFGISFAVNDIDEANSTVKNSESKDTADIEDFASKTKAAVTYDDVNNNTDIQYTVLSNGIKENIIVSSAADVKNAYSFDMNIGELTYTKEDNGKIVLKDNTGKTRFTIPAPVMYDSGFAFSYDIGVAVTDNSNGSITIVYTPSREWINSFDRKYPVTIDPVISGPSDEVIEDTCVSTIAPTTNGYDDILAVAGIVDNEYYETYVKMNMSLASILASNITPIDVELVFAGGAKNIAAYEITSPCDLTTVTYNDKPTLSTEVIDYYTGIENPDGLQAIHFNITKLFNDWISGNSNNYGIAIKEYDTSADSIALLLMTEYGSNGTAIYVDYIDVNGYDDTYKYTVNDVGRAGTSYVNDFTRELFITRDDLSIDGNIMPVTISFMYNSAFTKEVNKYKAFCEATNNSPIIVPGPMYGERWLTNYNRALIRNRYDSSVLSYYTENGTVINFIRDVDEENNEYYREETSEVLGAKGYVIDESDVPTNCTTEGFEYFKLIRPDGNIETFDVVGRLIKIQNSSHSDQSIDIHYVSQYAFNSSDFGNFYAIDYITDGVGRKYDFTYSNELLSSIQCYKANGDAITVGTSGSNLKTTYAYNSSNRLTSVTFADGKSVSYSYSIFGSTCKLSTITNLNTYRLTYSYDANDKITRIGEFAKGADDSSYQNGNYIRLVAFGPHQTKLIDGTGNTVIEQFDKYGRLVGTSDNKGNFNSESYGAEDMYSEAVGSVKHSPNLLQNSSFENGGTGWTGATYTHAAISTDYADSNTHSLKLYSDENVTKKVYQRISNPSIQTYTLSARIKPADDDTSHVMKMSLYAYNQSFSDAYIQSLPIAAIGGDFETYTVQITVLGNYNYLAAVFEFSNNCGEFYIDSVQLEGKIGASDYDYLTNGALESESGAVSSWTANSAYTIGEAEIASDDFNTVSFAGQHSLNVSKTLSQTVTVNAKAGDILHFGGWIKADYVFNSSVNKLAAALPDTTNYLDDRFVGLKLTYSYTELDENENPVNRTEIVKKQINDFVTDWQYAFLSTMVKGDCTSVTVSFENIKCPNDVSVANLTLNKYSGYGFEEEEEEIIEEPVTEPETPTGCQCSHCANPSCTCTCEDESTCTCATCRKRFDITYDEFGNLLSMTLNGLNLESLLSLVISRSYTSDGNYKTSQTDENGHSMSYAYNRANGFLTSQTDARGNTTSYQYDAMGRMTKITTPVSNLSNVLYNSMITDYTYDNYDRISKITHNGFSYKLEYDRWGNVTKITVVSGDEVLTSSIAAYQYYTGVNKNRLEAAAYGNLDAVYYAYNDNGDLQAIIHVNAENLENINPENMDGIVYYYNSVGELIGTQDNLSHRAVVYGSNCVCVYHQDELEYYAGYNTNGEFFEIINGQKFTEKKYDSETTSDGENLEKSAIVNVNGTLGITKLTDSFGRTKQTVLMSKDPTDENTSNYLYIENNYSYDITDQNNTVTPKSTIDTYETKCYNNAGCSPLLSGASYKYSYKYDANNNITHVYTVASNGTKTLKYYYKYDEANQLVRFDNYDNNNSDNDKAYVYQYDRGGNRVATRKYAGHTVGINTLESTTYANYNFTNLGLPNGNAWSDRLYSYNNKSITYDNAGNPLTYNGNTFSWRGKELVGYTKSDGTHYVFCYNAEGLRTQKKAYNSSNVLQYTVNYAWTNGKLAVEDVKINNQTIPCKFVYEDGQEAPSAVMTGDDIYLFLKSPQGDVLGIERVSDRKRVVDYNYDPWGKILTANYHSTLTDNDKLILKLICPFRYRGYCYDSDIGLYYLQARYYNPTWGRFINVDDTTILLSTVGETHNANLFAYCSNNPVNRVDYSGKDANTDYFIYTIMTSLYVLFYLSDYCTYRYFNIIPLSPKGGKISIQIAEDSFYEKIYDCVKIDEDITYMTMAIISNELFRKKLCFYDGQDKERSIVFSDECLKKEIQLHTNGYLSAIGKDDIKMPTRFNLYAFRIHPFDKSARKEFIKGACEVVDIEESLNGFYDLVEIIGFLYYFGIRDCYKNTKADPFYSETLNMRVKAIPISEKWKEYLYDYTD